MPPKPPLFDSALRNGFICRSCLTALRRRAPIYNFRRPYSRARGRPAGEKPNLSEPASRDIPLHDTDAATDAGTGTGRRVTVRHFEQNPVTGKIEPVGDEDGDEDALDEDDLAKISAGLDSKVRKLEADLKALQSRENIERLVTKHGGQKDRVDLILNWLEMADAQDNYAPKIEAQAKKKRDQKKLDLLNRWLRLAYKATKEGKVTSKLITDLWKAYCSARPVVLGLGDRPPQDVWDCLWKVFAEKDANPNRLAHIYRLSRHMDASSVALSGEQTLLAIEAMFVEKYRAEAIGNWKKLVTTLGAQKDTRAAYWELGVMMLSQKGDLERAERAAQALFQKEPDADPRIILHLVRAFAKNPNTVDRAFDVYRDLRRLLGKSMKIEDYDEITSCFLVNGHTDLAFYAFTDMMFDGSVDLRGKKRLPSAVSNYFYMGKWLKRLIGAGDLNSALNVLAYMQANGIMAAAVQVNGLIAAWQRTEDARDLQKADKLAWAMIQSRLKFVELRRRDAALEWPLRLQDMRTKTRQQTDGDAVNLTLLPGATLETFCLMARNYRSRGLHRRLQELFVAYKECEISGDAFMMNQLIESAVEQGHHEKARELYHLMVDEHHILPNPHTYYCLFKSLAVNRILHSAHTPELKEEDKVLARQLFKDLMRSIWVLQEHKKGLPEHHIKLILHSFRKCEDYVGVVAAIRGLRDVARFKMTRGILLELVAEHENLEKQTKRAKTAIVRATRTLSALLAEMRLKDTDKALKPGVQYKILELYYRNKVKVDDLEFEELYHGVATSMGVLYDSGKRRRK